MVEPALNPGVIRFAIVLTIMVLTAGVASLPPARDFRVFLGAAILCGAWVVALAAQKYFDEWAITSSFFILDAIYVIGFYLISRPRPGDPPDAVKERNWAGYIVAVLTILVAVQIAHVLTTKEFFLRPLAIVLLGAFSFVIFLGFARGFGWPIAILYLTLLFLINLIAFRYYVKASNILTMLAYLILLWRAARGAKHNLVRWFQILMKRRKRRPRRLE